MSRICSTACAGKIYTTDKIPWALEHFFQNRNLATLRELALREVAESLGRSAATPNTSATTPNGWGGKLMVCLSSNPPHGRTLLRRGSRLAGRLNTDWYVVYVETPQEDPLCIDAAAQRNLHKNIELAKELGAEVVSLRSEEPVDALFEFARSHGVSDIVIGRGHHSLLERLLRRSFTSRMVERAAGFDLHIVSFMEPRAEPSDAPEAPE